MGTGWLFLECYIKGMREDKGRQEDLVYRCYVGFIICVLRHMYIVDQI